MTTRTGSAIITRALKLLRAVGVDDTVSSTELSDGLLVLQEMLLSWANEPYMADSTYTLPTYADTSTPVTVHDALVEALPYNLALRLAPDYGKEAGASVVGRAMASKMNWKRLIYEASPAYLENPTGYMDRTQGWYDITAG